MKSNDSPWAREVESWSERELLKFVAGLVGYDAPFTTSWDAAMAMCDKLGVLRHPKYMSRTQSGTWVIRDHLVKNPIAMNSSGPVVLCQLCAIVIGGKGRCYSREVTNREKESASGP